MKLKISQLKHAYRCTGNKPQVNIHASEHSLEEAGDVLAAAAGPPGQRGAVQELWRHDERSFPNRFTVITVAIMLNPKAAT